MQAFALPEATTCDARLRTSEPKKHKPTPQCRRSNQIFFTKPGDQPQQHLHHHCENPLRIVQRRNWNLGRAPPLFKVRASNSAQTMGPNMKYWDDWADAADMAALWSHPDVSQEWLRAGEARGMKVHMSRNFDGKPYVTHTEMKGMAEVITRRHFKQLDVAMICAIAEVESSRQPLAYRFEPRLGEASTGLMQTLQSTAEWLATDMGYRAYAIEGVSALLYRPFVSVYFGTAYLKWLSTYDGIKRNEEFMVRGYNGGPQGAAKTSTLGYWHKYLLAKQSLPTPSNSLLNSVTPVAVPRPPSPKPPPPPRSPTVAAEAMKPTRIESGGVSPIVVKLHNIKITASSSADPLKKEWTYWDEKVSAEDLDAMWRHPEVRKEWTHSNEKKGEVRFARDAEHRPYLTSTELKAVAEIIVSRFFAERVDPVMLQTIAEVGSKRRLHGGDGISGVMQTAYPTAAWLHKDMGYKAYQLRSADDLSNPFLAVYFGAAYVCWLSNYSGRPRTDEFVVRAYRGGPHGVTEPSAELFWQQYVSHLPQQPHAGFAHPVADVIHKRREITHIHVK